MYDTTDNQMFGLHALLGPAAVLHEHGGDVTTVELAVAAPLLTPTCACGALSVHQGLACEWERVCMLVAGLVVDVLAAEVAVGLAG